MRALGLACVLVVMCAVGAAPASATAPGDNGRLAFIHGCCDQYDLAAADASLTTLNDLTDPYTLEFVNGPSWSPDGRLVFSARPYGSDVRASAELWIMDGDGTDLTRLTRTGPWESDPAWSPDGAQIAFMRRGDLFVINADGSGRHPLTQTRRFEWSPEWSPDGSTLSFLRDTRRGTDMFLLDPVTFGEERLTRTAANEYNETWLPDGTGIVYTSYRWANHSSDTGIWVLNLGTHTATPVLNDPSIDERSPVVSPDGARMAWVRVSPNPDPNLIYLSELIVSDPDGSNAAVLDSCVLECSFYQLSWETLP